MVGAQGDTAAAAATTAGAAVMPPFSGNQGGGKGVLMQVSGLFYVSVVFAQVAQLEDFQESTRASVDIASVLRGVKPLPARSCRLIAFS